MEKTAIYPGTFDPVTNGHVDLITRAICMFKNVIVAVANNPDKKVLFGFEERKRFIEESIGDLNNVRVESFDTLLVHYVRKQKADVIIRGIRAVTDFDYEYQMAMMNRSLDSGIETVFLLPSEEYSYVSSRLIKEISELGGEVGHLIPPIVEAALKDKFASLKKK